jgi:RimJ/RimL family protein N-acetyltransferase
MTADLHPVLETLRLFLRAPSPMDWSAYRAYRASPRSTFGTGFDETVAWTHFAAFFGHWQLRGFGRFILTLRDGGEAIGHAGPFQPEGQAERELTWTLWDAAHEGKGLAYEAALACRNHAFDGLGWDTAVSYITTGNVKSERLAERLGARPDPAAHKHDARLTVWRHNRGDWL